MSEWKWARVACATASSRHVRTLLRGQRNEMSKGSWSGFDVRAVARVWGARGANVEAFRPRLDLDEKQACFGKQLRSLALPTDTTDSVACGGGWQVKSRSKAVGQDKSDEERGRMSSMRCHGTRRSLWAGSAAGDAAAYGGI